jgi:ribosome-binding factor A
MTSIRQNKVASLIQQELAQIFQRELRNAFGSGLITVTHVFMSPDLSFAKTYLSIFADKEKNNTLEHIRAQAKEIRGLLGRRIKTQLRIVPEVAFFLDESADYVEHIEKIFQTVNTPAAEPEQNTAQKPKRKSTKKKKSD